MGSLPGNQSTGELVYGGRICVAEYSLPATFDYFEEEVIKILKRCDVSHGGISSVYLRN